MKKITTYCVIALATIPIHLSATLANQLPQSQVVQDAFLGCANPEYPFIEKRFWPTQTSALAIDIQSNGVVLLKENVKIPIDGGTLSAQSASYDSNSQSVQEIQQGSLYYLDSYFQFQSGSLNGQSKNFSFVDGKSYLAQRNLLIEYESLTGEFGTNLLFNDARLTSCLDPLSGWQISGKTIAINESSQRGYVKDLSLHVRNKKVLKLPYFPFTTSSERLSGFLEPDIGITSDGLDLYAPYFLVLSGKSDITMAPRLLRDRGVGLEVNYRYLTRDNLNNYLDLMYFPGDKKAKKYYALNDARWAFKLKDSRQWHNINGEISWAKSSDPMVLLDLPSSLTSVANQQDHYLPQSIKVSTNVNNLSISIARQGYQSLNPFLSGGYVKEPEVELAYQSFIGPLSYFGRILYSDFDANQKNYNSFTGSTNLITGSRTVAEIGSSSRHQVGFLNIALNGSVITKKYSLNTTSNELNSSTIPSFDATFSATARQVMPQGVSLITPSLSYARTNYQDQSLDPVFDLHIRSGHYLGPHNKDIFFGKDRVADQEYVLAQIKWQAHLNNRHRVLFQLTKKNELQASKVFNQMLGLDLKPDQRTGLKAQWDGLQTNAVIEINYSHITNQTNFMNAYYEIQLQETQLSVSRKFRRQVPLLGRVNELDYGEVTLDHNLAQGYRFLAGISKDLSSNKNLASYFGIGYENCCVALKLFASDKRLSKYDFLNAVSLDVEAQAWENMISIENKSRINFEFELKGITGSKTQLNKFFSSTFANF